MNDNKFNKKCSYPMKCVYDNPKDSLLKWKKIARELNDVNV